MSKGWLGFQGEQDIGAESVSPTPTSLSAGMPPAIRPHGHRASDVGLEPKAILVVARGLLD